jgi:septal ring factor EnvC (AmiA/AmiB activator)
MKEGIGLAVFAMVSVFAIGMAVGKRIHTSILVVLLLFAMASGWGIAHHDWLRLAQFQVPGFELFQTRITQIREDALYEMKKSASAERETLASLLAASDETQQKLTSEGKAAEELVETIRTVEESLKERERQIKEMSDQAQTARDQMVAVQQTVSELALALTRILYLSLEAKDQYGQERAQTAIRQIMDSLDELVGLCITDPQGRADFVLGVTSSLPPRQGN